ncbi:MAG: endonuclease domain-containing protein [Lachnospiraceae bacterium]|nr:endonuclease domain-containing protein [Oscillospiraceae bacterium]MBQ7564875.1 endonuclease domain-containing protein [Lachnospiraceae bacterium]
MSNMINPKLTEFSRENRKNLTPEELKIWLYCLRDFPVRVHRQKVIGRYIADFYIAKYKTVIEIDGSQHYEKEGLEYDAERTAYFESLGMKVLRYTNREINRDFNSVCEDIKKMLGID